MSTFTQFSADEQLSYSKEASERYKKDLWAVIPGFRFYIGGLSSNSYVDVESGFLTDGATIPRFLWWLLPPLSDYSQCTTTHDKLCQTYYILRLIDGVETKIPVSRKEIDSIFAEAMVIAGVKAWKRTLINAGLTFYRLTTNPTTPKSLADSI